MTAFKSGAAFSVIALAICGIFLAHLAHSQSPDDWALLARQADEAFKSDKYPEALAIQQRILDSIETSEKTRTGGAGPETAAALANLAWYALHAGAHDEALAACERAKALAPKLIWIDSNRAHALLLLNKSAEARALYLAHKGKIIPESGDKTWEEVIEEDFASLQRVGLQLSVLNEVLSSLGIDVSIPKKELDEVQSEIAQLRKIGRIADVEPIARRYAALAGKR